MVKASIAPGGKPRASGAPFLVLPPAISLAVAEQSLHRGDVSIGRDVKGHDPELPKALAGHTQRSECLQDPLQGPA